MPQFRISFRDLFFLPIMSSLDSGCSFTFRAISTDRPRRLLEWCLPGEKARLGFCRSAGLRRLCAAAELLGEASRICRNSTAFAVPLSARSFLILS